MSKPKSLTQPLELEDDELLAGLVIDDQLLFELCFFPDELALECSLEQKLFMCDESQRVLLCTGRKVAKTVRIESKILQEGVRTWDRGQAEAMCFTPADVHLNQIMARVYSRVDRDTVLGLFVKGRSSGDNASITFMGGLKWWFRIEGLSGKDTNMVGLRAIFIVGDELAFGNWVCHNSRIQTALPGCQWLYAGVPNGVRGTPFFALDTSPDDAGWSRHKCPTYANPLYWAPERRVELIELYGGAKTQGYINNVDGLWGEELVSIFPPGSLALHNRPYKIMELGAFSSDFDLKTNLSRRLVIPPMPCDGFALGWDYGLAMDPSVIIGAMLTVPTQQVLAPGQQVTELWQTYFRLTLNRVAIQHQIAIIRYLIATVFIGPFMGLSTDKQEAVQLLQAADPAKSELFFYANPGGLVHFPIEVVVPIEGGGTKTETQMASIGVKEHLTDNLSGWMTNASIQLPGTQLELSESDMTVQNELTSTTAQKLQSGRTIYHGPPAGYGQMSGADHNTETLRYLTDAIERGYKLRNVQQANSDRTKAMGFVGGGVPVGDVRTFTPPWVRRQRREIGG